MISSSHLDASPSPAGWPECLYSTGHTDTPVQGGPARHRRSDGYCLLQMNHEASVLLFFPVLDVQNDECFFCKRKLLLSETEVVAAGIVHLIYSIDGCAGWAKLFPMRLWILKIFVTFLGKVWSSCRRQSMNQILMPLLPADAFKRQL